MRPIFGKLFSYLVFVSGFFILLIVVNSKGKYGKTKVITYVNRREGKYQDILNLVKCQDKPMDFRIVQKSTFWVFNNFIKAKKRFKCQESVTLTTNADFRFLDNLIPLVKRWKGPISLAIYAPGEDFFKTIDSIAYLRNCESVLIKEFVTFHLFFDFTHTPYKMAELSLPRFSKLELYLPANAINFLSMNATSLTKAYKDSYSCSRKPPFKSFDPSKTYKATKNLTYPINVARNIAREAAQTHFIFPSDIELYPTYNFIDKFLKMISNNHSLVLDPQPKVFVLPIFEVLSNVSVPNTKTDLQKMIANKSAFLFHQKLCAICHKVPNDHEWMKEQENDELSVFTIGKRQKHHRFWEAFYVGTNADPLFDERLTWEGQSNKMAQGFALCLLDYNYMVLDNAFLIHRPGIKKAKEQIKKYGNSIAKTNYLIRHHIKPELEAMYGHREGCVLG